MLRLFFLVLLSTLPALAQETARDCLSALIGNADRRYGKAGFSWPYSLSPECKSGLTPQLAALIEKASSIKKKPGKMALMCPYQLDFDPIYWGEGPAQVLELKEVQSGATRCQIQALLQWRDTTGGRAGQEASRGHCLYTLEKSDGWRVSEVAYFNKSVDAKGHWVEKPAPETLVQICRRILK